MRQKSFEFRASSTHRESKGSVVAILVMVLFAATAHAQRVGTIDQATEGWYPAGAELAVTATPLDYQHVEWRGDTNTAVVAGETLTVSVDGPLEIDVVFIDHVTENTGTPWWFLAERDPERDWTPEAFEDAAVNETAASGAPLWESYVTGMDTEDPEAVFAISRVFFQNGRPHLIWWHDRVPPRPITIQFRESLLEGDWENVGVVTGVDDENTFESSEGEQGFYRLVVEMP